MPGKPLVIVFDVNETLSNMSPLGERFADVGAPATLAKLWFASLLRDGFALAAAGDNRGFAGVGAGALRALLPAGDLDRSLDEAVEHIMSGFMDLEVHPDVPDGIRDLKEAGYRLVTLSNGSTKVAEQLFERDGLRAKFEALLSVEDAPAWKPAPAAYHYAATTCGVEAGDMLLVAVHPWDIHGAAKAGLQTAWINRTGAPYPVYFEQPGHTVPSMAELPTALAAGTGR